MKNLLNPFTVLLFCSLLMVGCEKSPAPPPEEEEEIVDVIEVAIKENTAPYICGESSSVPIETFYNNEFERGTCFKNIKTPSRIVGVIIKNQAAYEKYMGCSSALPLIDFDNYFIIGGLFRNTSCSKEAHEENISLCSNKIIYKAIVRKGICAGPSITTSLVVIEKKYSSSEVVFDLQIIL